jgi:hypothetical protein
MGSGPLRAALRATDGGIGCHHRLRAELGLGVETLDALGLVKPIRQRIPTCDEHPCPHHGNCQFATIFTEGLAGRSGKKYRLTPLGEGALRDPAIARQIDEAARELPLARRILAALGEGPGGQTIFALNTILLEQSLAALAADGAPGDAAFSRGELAGMLGLLEALGAIGRAGERVTMPLAEAAPADTAR